MFHIFHKWDELVKQEVRYALGDSYNAWVPAGYRRCLKCGLIQQGTWTSQGMLWGGAHPKEWEILDRKLEEGAVKWESEVGGNEKDTD